MEFFRKKLRFYFWFVLEFLKKNLLWVSLGFVGFFIGLFLLFLLKPLFLRLIFAREEKIGIVGNYSYRRPPEEVLELISRPMLIIDKKGKVEPILLTQWEVKKNGKIFRFHFRKDLVWNDGKPFSVRDIAGQLFKDAKISIIDDYTLEVELDNPTIVLPYYLRRPIYRYPLVGLGGEYEVANIKLKEGDFSEILLVSKISGSKKRFRFYKTESELVNAFKVGKIDKFELRDQELVQELKDWKNLNVERQVDYKFMAVLFFNLKNKLLAEKDFREGVYRLVDWGKLTEFGEISKGPIPPVSNFYNNSLPTPISDEEKGSELIKELVKDKKVKLTIKTDYRLAYLAEDLSDKLSKVGIEAEVETLIGEVGEDFDILVAFWRVPLEVDQYFFWHSTQIGEANKTGYKNLRVDKYLEEARSTFSFEKQYLALKKFQEEIVRDKPAIFLYFPYKYIVERKRLF